MPLVRIQDGCLAFGHVALLDHIELNVEERERVCLIGRNGAGKSTLLNVLAGDQLLDSGQMRRGDGVRVAKLAQEVPATADSSLFDVVAAGLGDHSGLLGRYHRASQVLAEAGDAVASADLEAFGRLQSEVEDAGAWEGSQRIDAVLSRMTLQPDALMSECSGGVRRRAMLGQALVSQPDLLLLDEPTNHLDIEAIDALEEALLGYQGAVLFVTHDRTLIDHLATRIVELDRGALTSFPGTYASYQNRKAALLDAEANSNRKFDHTLAQEEVWIRQGIKARRTRNEGRVRRLEAMRRERALRRDRKGNAKMVVAAGERSGMLVVEVEGVEFAYDDDDPVIRNFSTLILRGDRIGIVGRNGSGKSTLLKLLVGDLSPSNGSIRLGTKLNVAYFDQERQQLDVEATVRDNLAEGAEQIVVNGKSRHVTSYLADFLFPPARVMSPVKTLSGGERNRLLLAKLFSRPANLLVLDEPTNDLDVETLELLEELISEYDGTLLLVSHDRSFLDETVTSTLALAGDGTVVEHVGGYSDWMEYSKRVEQTSTVDRTSTTEAPKRPDRSSRDRGGKLSYAEQRELDALPDLIESLESAQAEIQARLSDPEFYKTSQDTIAEANKELDDIEKRLNRAYERWQEIES